MINHYSNHYHDQLLPNIIYHHELSLSHGYPQLIIIFHHQSLLTIYYPSPALTIPIFFCAPKENIGGWSFPPRSRAELWECEGVADPRSIAQGSHGQQTDHTGNGHWMSVAIGISVNDSPIIHYKLLIIDHEPMMVCHGYLMNVRIAIMTSVMYRSYA